MLDRPIFTKEQKEYLRFNLRWINNPRLDEWIECLDEPINESFGGKE